LDAYRASLVIREKLAAADPANLEGQRDLSISYDNVGSLLLAGGREDDALAIFRQSLLIRERLVAVDPGNTQWRRDVAYSHEHIGAALAKGDRREEALGAFRKCLAIREALVALDPGNADWQTDLVVIVVKLADIGDEPRARLTRALKILQQLAAEGKLRAAQREWIGIIERSLAALSG
jgi:tetratricopeptide (TPR) repeat protein